MYRLQRCSARIIGPLLVLALCLLLAACSSIKLAYNNSTTLAYWWLDRYVDLDDAQSTEVRLALAQLRQWHRREELPRLADLLHRMQAQAVQDVTPEQVCAVFTEARERFDSLVRHAEPASASLAMSLQPAQIAHIAARFEKTNSEWREEWIEGGAAGRLEKRLKSNRERAEDFYGRLQAPQVALLSASLDASDFDPQLNFRERVRRQQDLLQTLRMSSAAPAGSPGPTAEQVRTALRGYVERSTRSPDPAYRAWSEKAVQRGCRTVAELHNATSSDQRAKAVNRLREHERHLRELASAS